VPEKEGLAGLEDTSSLAGEWAGALQQPASTFASGEVSEVLADDRGCRGEDDDQRELKPVLAG
jgi:hypothetical protein